MIKVDAVALAEALGKAVSDSRCGVTGYDCAKLVCDGKAGLHITTTDGGMTVTDSIESSGKAMTLVANTEKLRMALKGAIGEAAIDVSADGNSCVVSGKRWRYTIPLLPVEQFPPMDELEFSPIEVDPLKFAAALNAVKYAMAKNDVRYYLNGITVTDSHVIAADGFRMGIAPLSIGIGKVPKFIISNSGVPNVLSRLAEGGDDAKVSLLMRGSEAIAMAVSSPIGHTQVALIDGNPPDFHRVANSHGKDVKIECDAAELRAAMERVAPFCERRWVRVVQDDDRIILQSKDGSCSEEVVAEIEGIPDFVMDAGFISNMLASTKGERVTWYAHNYVTDKKGPSAFFFSGRDDAHYIPQVG